MSERKKIFEIMIIKQELNWCDPRNEDKAEQRFIDCRRRSYDSVANKRVKSDEITYSSNDGQYIDHGLQRNKFRVRLEGQARWINLIRAKDGEEVQFNNAHIAILTMHCMWQGSKLGWSFEGFYVIAYSRAMRPYSSTSGHDFTKFARSFIYANIYFL